MGLFDTLLISGNSPTSATTAAVGSPVGGLLRFDWLTIDAKLIGSTNGNVDAVLQRQLGEGSLDIWADWVRFPLVAAAATEQYHLSIQGSTTIHQVNWGTAAAPGTPVIAANTSIGGHPGNKIRLVVTAGAGTDSAAAQLVYVSGWQTR